MSGGITGAHVDQALDWLIGHGHSIEGIAHPEGESNRFLAAVALELNVSAFSNPETARLIVDVIAYVASGHTVCTHVA